MELKELTDKTLELFEVKSVEQLGQQLLEVCKGTDKLEAFSNLVDGDLTQDWMQKIYQYYLADRKEKKQDYTPKSVAQLMGALIGDTDKVVDMCAVRRIGSADHSEMDAESEYRGHGTGD